MMSSCENCGFNPKEGFCEKCADKTFTKEELVQEQLLKHAVEQMELRHEIDFQQAYW